MPNKKRIWCFLVSFILIIPNVIAASETILDFYMQYYGWIDFAIYILIFTGLIKEFVKVKFKKKGILSGEELSSGAKALSIGLGLGLAIALATWEIKSGFYLYQIAPLIVVLLGILIILSFIGWVKEIFKSKGLGMPKLRTFAIYFLVLIGILHISFPSLFYYYLPWGWVDTLKWILIIAAFVIILLSFSIKGKKEEYKGEREYRGEGKEGLMRSIGKALGIGGKKLYQAYKNWLRVSIIPLPWKVRFLSLRRKSFKREKAGGKITYVKAGDPLTLFANIQGGSGNYTIQWTVNGKTPDKIYGETRNKKEIEIPTQVLQERKSQSLEELIKKGKKIGKKVGEYVWKVEVFDNELNKSDRDKIKIIINKNEKLETDQEREYNKLLKEKKPNLTILPPSEYSNNKNRYLIERSKNSKFKAKIEGTIENINWIIQKEEDKKNIKEKTGKTKGEINEVSFNLSKVEEGKYIIYCIGNHKIKGEIKSEETKIYIKKKRQIKAFLKKEDIRNNEIIEYKELSIPKVEINQTKTRDEEIKIYFEIEKNPLDEKIFDIIKEKDEYRILGPYKEGKIEINVESLEEKESYKGIKVNILMGTEEYKNQDENPYTEEKQISFNITLSPLINKKDKEKLRSILAEISPIAEVLRDIINSKEYGEKYEVSQFEENIEDHLLEIEKIKKGIKNLPEDIKKEVDDFIQSLSKEKTRVNEYGQVPLTKRKANYYYEKARKIWKMIEVHLR